MFSLKFIRENADAVRKGCEDKFSKVDLDQLLDLDEKRRQLIQEADNLKAKRNRVSDEIAVLKKNKQDASSQINEMKTVSQTIKDMDENLRQIDAAIQDILIWVPNIAHKSVPVGSEADNLEIKSWGKKKTFDFTVQPHYEIGPKLGLIEFDRASRLSGANFAGFTGNGARLVRGLINFMIDLHVTEHGFQEAWMPSVVKREAMFGTGQLPKMEDDMYYVPKDEMYLIPTAEVPITNLHREEILPAEKLPAAYVGYTPCFRREAGSYGADTRGLMRIHQFDKVEMVKFVRPENSYNELEILLQNAEKVVQLLGLPYRVLTLATGDTSFASAKTYDLEVYAPGIDKWLEVSSVSNFEDFQARRMNIRYRPAPDAKTEFIHTLNGSGVALPRTLIAILENYQNADGTVTVPDVLRDYVRMDVFE